MLVDLDDGSEDSLLGAIVKVLTESVLASAVALKRCSRRFKVLAAPLVASAVAETNQKWRDAAAKIGCRGGAAITYWCSQPRARSFTLVSAPRIHGPRETAARRSRCPHHRDRSGAPSDWSRIARFDRDPALERRGVES